MQSVIFFPAAALGTALAAASAMGVSRISLLESFVMEGSFLRECQQNVSFSTPVQPDTKTHFAAKQKSRHQSYLS
jgi:hypothetical protein